MSKIYNIIFNFLIVAWKVIPKINKHLSQIKSNIVMQTHNLILNVN